MRLVSRIRDPHYGMVVTDATGTCMLISRRSPEARGDGALVWRAHRLDMDVPSNHIGRDYILLLDPDAFGEVIDD